MSTMKRTKDMQKITLNKFLAKSKHWHENRHRQHCKVSLSACVERIVRKASLPACLPTCLPCCLPAAYLLSFSPLWASSYGIRLCSRVYYMLQIDNVVTIIVANVVIYGLCLEFFTLFLATVGCRC